METQYYQGNKYTLYKGERYFTRGRKFLHRVVFETNFGKIPDNMEIHHIDFDPKNNFINNLQLVTKKQHMKIHSENRSEDFKKWQKDHLASIRNLTKDWHKSEVGRKWHMEHAKKINFGNITYGNRNCEFCGVEFLAKTNHHKFCHQNCKAKALRLRRKLAKQK